ncbi:hypothetical protein LEMLEM_LOCUS12438 [Lemmus lemmus]
MPQRNLGEVTETQELPQPPPTAELPRPPQQQSCQGLPNSRAAKASPTAELPRPLQQQSCHGLHQQQSCHGLHQQQSCQGLPNSRVAKASTNSRAATASQTAELPRPPQQRAAMASPTSELAEVFHKLGMLLVQIKYQTLSNLDFSLLDTDFHLSGYFLENCRIDRNLGGFPLMTFPAEGSGATSDPAEGSPSQSRRILSQFGSTGSEGSSNELKHSKLNLMEKDHPGWNCHAGRVVLTRCAASTPVPAAGAPILAARGRAPPPPPRWRVRRRRAGEESLGPGYEWVKADRCCLSCRCPLCRPGAAPRTSAGRCRCLASRLLGPPLRAARRLRAHAREGALARRQPRASRPSPPPVPPRSRPFSRGVSAPRRGRGGGEASRHEDIRGQSQRAGPRRGPASERAAPSALWIKGEQGASSRDAAWAPGGLGQGCPAPGALSNSLQACPRLDGERPPWEPKVALDRLWAFG